MILAGLPSVWADGNAAENRPGVVRPSSLMRARDSRPAHFMPTGRPCSYAADPLHGTHGTRATCHLSSPVPQPWRVLGRLGAILLAGQRRQARCEPPDFSSPEPRRSRPDSPHWPASREPFPCGVGAAGAFVGAFASPLCAMFHAVAERGKKARVPTKPLKIKGSEGIRRGKKWSGRGESNPRRSAWECERRPPQTLGI
jgi:hypothetical protein